MQRNFTAVRRYAAAAAVGVGCAWFALVAAAQSRRTFTAQLSALPADARTRPGLAGSGSVTATLSGNKLQLNGSFEGLLSPATAAAIHRGVATGVRGPVIFDLTIAKAQSGSISGTFDLTPQQAEDLRMGRFYVQIESDKEPKGNLWGWLLLPRETER
jgi:hypothetical protein